MNCDLCGQEIDGEIRQEDFQVLEELYGQTLADKMKSDDTHVCRDCANKERTKKIVDKYKPYVTHIFQAVNRSLLNQQTSDALVQLLHREHRFLQGEFMMFLMRTLFTYGEGSGDLAWEDDRNAWGLAWAKAAASLDVHKDRATGKYVAILPKQ